MLLCKIPGLVIMLPCPHLYRSQNITPALRFNNRERGFKKPYALKVSPLVVAFWDGRSHGTEDMINKARAAGVECVVVSYPKEASE